MSPHTSPRPRRKPPAPPTPIPAQVAEWARAHIGALAPWPLPIDLSGARPWRVSTPQGLIDIRVVRTDLDLHREVIAYRTAIHRLDPAHGPRLIAYEPRLRTLLTTHPRGRPVDDAAFLRVLPRIHQDAGRLLAVLHSSVDQIADARVQAVRHLARYAQHIVRLLDRTTTWLSLEESEAVRRSADRLLERGEVLPVAFCHGAFSPATWRWNLQAQTLSLTGLGRSQVLPAVLDFARGSSLWSEHPHLDKAFFTAYGRPLDDAELPLLTDAALLAAVEDLHHALVLRDGEALSVAGATFRDAVRRLPPTLHHAVVPDREHILSLPEPPRLQQLDPNARDRSVPLVASRP